MPKQKKNQNQNQNQNKTLQSEVFIKKCRFKWLFIYFSLFDVDQLYETHLLEKISNDKSNNP
jgi:hypothetical protein